MGSRLNLWGSAQAYRVVGAVETCGGTAPAYGESRAGVGDCWHGGRRLCMGEPPACMGNGNPMKAGNMKAGCGLRTLQIFGSIGGGSWVWGIITSTEATPESATVGSRDARSSCCSAPRWVAPCWYVQKSATTRNHRNAFRAATMRGITAPRTPLDLLRAIGAVQAGGRSWGRDRGRPVCRSSRARTWSNPSLSPSNDS